MIISIFVKGVIQKSKTHQFGYLNSINTYNCYNYLQIFQDFILMKKTIITCIYPIISILKLRLSGNISIFYLKIHSYIIVLL